MTPNFDIMTTAELRSYCFSVDKVGRESHKILSELLIIYDQYGGKYKNLIPNKYLKIVEQSLKNINKLEILGLGSKKDNQ